MATQTQIELITERVERLLLRYQEQQRTNALLSEQLALLTHERDSLKSRLSAARARVDALLAGPAPSALDPAAAAELVGRVASALRAVGFDRLPGVAGEAAAASR